MFSLATYKCILCKRFLFYTHGFRWKTHNPDDSLLLGIQKMTSMSMSYWNMTEKNNFCYFKYWQIPARPDELRLNCGFSSMAIQYGVKTNGLYPLAACIFLWLWPKQTFLWNIINIFTIIIYCVVLKNLKYRVFIKYCVFSLKFFDFSELCRFCCSAGFLPACCVYTHWRWGKTEKGQSPEYFKIFGKNTIFSEHPVQSYTWTQQY